MSIKSEKSEIKSREAVEYIHKTSNDADQFNPLHSVVEYHDACEGIRIAESDAEQRCRAEDKERAVRAFKRHCGSYCEDRTPQCVAFRIDCIMGCGSASAFLKHYDQ